MCPAARIDESRLSSRYRLIDRIRKLPLNPRQPDNVKPALATKRGAFVIVLAGFCISEVRIQYLRHSAEERKMPGYVHSKFCFEAIGSARALKLERSIIGQIDLFGSAVDQEEICACGDPTDPMRCPDLNEIRSGYSLALRSLHNDTSIGSRNTSSIVGVQCDRKA